MIMRFFLNILFFISFSLSALAATVTEQALQDIEAYLSNMSGFVVDVDRDNKIFTDLGGEKRAVPGLKLMAYSEGEDIIHPVTGLVLGKKQEVIGILTIMKVENKYSIASFTNIDNNVKASRRPVKLDAVGIQLPLKINLSFDNATEEDLQVASGIIAASNTFRESSDADSYKLTLRRTGKTVGYTLEQTDNIVVLSGNLTETDIQTLGELKPAFRTDLPRGRYVSIAMGKIYKDDPKLYLVSIAEDRIVIFDPLEDFAKVEEIQVKQGQMLNVEVADLDGDGQDEIFVSNVTKGSTVSSFIYKHGSEGLKQVQKDIPWLFRSVREPSGNRSIISQRLTSNGEYNGEVFYFKFAEGKYAEDVAIKGTLGKSLFGFSLYETDKGALFLNVGKGSKFSISSSKKTEYNAPNYYGDTFHILPVKEKKRTAGKATSADAADAVIEMLDKRIFITPRIEIVNDEQFAIVQNNLYTRVFTASPVFSESAILLYAYKHGVLKKTGGISSLQPVIADIWVYEDKGKYYLAALTSNNTWAMQTGASSITLFEMP